MAVGVVAIGAVVASQTLAVTPPITGPDGKRVPGSIAVMESVDLGGSEQWITIRGLVDSFNAVYPQLEDLDFVEQAPSLEVPVFFFVGRHDVNAMPSLVEEYADVLEAPEKELIWLEGGHGLGSAENTDVFVEVMLEQVRPLAVG